MMTSNSPWVSVKRPIRKWNERLKIDFRAYFEAMSHAVIHGAVGNWEDFAKDAVEGIKSLGFGFDESELAWLLIRRALNQATIDLVKEHVTQLAKNRPENQGEILDKLDLSLEDAEIEISPTFFDRPAELPVLELFKKPFKQWLTSYGLAEAQADTIADRLPSYFVFALKHEWRQRPEVYAPIKASMDTPFTPAAERQQGWDYYYAWLRKQINESVFNETFSLNQVYVPLRAYYKTDEKSPDRVMSGNKQKTLLVTDLKTTLDAWLNKSDSKDARGDAIRVISGGPGSGKSSFTRMYAAHLTHNSKLKVLYIPLHQFDPKGDLTSGVHEFVGRSELLPLNPLDSESPEPRLLLIFDGLDELSMQGKVGADTVREFIDHVDRTVNQYNIQRLRLQVLMSGREVVVQANESKFRKDAQILHILPYFLSEDQRKAYNDSHALLSADHRQLWWQKYGTATGQRFETMPEELHRDDLVEITAQPLLNYLVALSYTRGELNFSEQINLNVIYADLLKAVYDRDYEGGKHQSVRALSLTEFNRILEEIGLATWHGNGRTTTIREVHQHCTSAGLSKLLEIFQEGAEAGVARLLTAFYFRQHDDGWQGERTFEFTHKSFGEYLTGRRIVYALERMFTKLMQRKNSLDDGWDEREALKHWAEVYGDAPRMTRDIYRFVQGEVVLKGAATAADLQQLLCSLIDWVLRYGMPMELLDPRPNYRQENTAAIRAEEALLAALYACAIVTKKVSYIHEFQESITVTGEWLSRLQGQRSGIENTLALQCLGFLDLSGRILFMRDLYQADLRDANLRNALLTYAILAGANLERANLMRTNLMRANLQEANLVRASLVGASLVGASLEGASLVGANLVGANLVGANLVGANLDNTTLPDGTRWTPDTDMARFTDPQHPDFWRSDDPVSPAYRGDGDEYEDQDEDQE